MARFFIFTGQAGRFGLVAGLALLAGCMTPPYDDPARQGPFFYPSNHVGEAALPGNIRRIVLLPISGGEIAPASSTTSFDPVMVTALQQQNRFEVVAISRDACRRMFGVDEISSVSALPPNFMAEIAHEYAADAVMFIDVTVFRPYRPLAIGLRAKLATIRDVRLVWTFDNVFSASDPTVANSARHYLLQTSRRDVPTDMSPAVLQSPSNFAAYAADAMFSTLPPVANAPEPAKAP